MKSVKLFGAALLAIVSGAVRISGQVVTAPATQPNSTRLRSIIARLGEADFAERQAAQKELEASSPRDLDFLRNAADSAADPEIKSRLLAGIANIEDQSAINPPPINLSIANATAGELAAALGSETHLHFIDGGELRMAGGKVVEFSLEAHQKPFWDVFFALSEQAPLSFQWQSRGAVLIVDHSKWNSHVVTGPLVVIPRSITRVVDLQADGSAATMTFAGTMGLDPRIKAIQYSGPRFTQIIDDLGNNLAPPLPPSDVLSYATPLPSSPPPSFFYFSVPLSNGEKKGSRIVSAKGAVRFIAETAQMHVDIDDAEKHVGQVVSVGHLDIRLVSFDREVASDNRESLVLLLKASSDPKREPVTFADPRTVFGVTIIDATGREVFSSLAVGSRITFPSDGVVSPLKAHFTATSRTKDFTIPFELKDIPLP